MLSKKQFTFPDYVNELLSKDLSDIYKKTLTVPGVNIIESNEKFKIEIAAPGLEKADFNIDLDDNLLTISANKEQKEEENIEKVMSEFNYAAFKRSFTLPKSANVNKIAAQYVNGILIIDIPKRDEAIYKGPRTISIS